MSDHKMHVIVQKDDQGNWILSDAFGPPRIISSFDEAAELIAPDSTLYHEYRKNPDGPRIGFICFTTSN